MSLDEYKQQTPETFAIEAPKCFVCGCELSMRGLNDVQIGEFEEQFCDKCYDLWKEENPSLI